MRHRAAEPAIPVWVVAVRRAPGPLAPVRPGSVRDGRDRAADAADVNGDAFRKMQCGAIKTGRVTGDGDADDDRADWPERREQREPGEHAEGGEDGMPADVRRRCGRRRRRGGTVVCDGHVTRLCDGVGLLADQASNSCLTLPFRCRYHDVTLPWTEGARMSRHNRAAGVGGLTADLTGGLCTLLGGQPRRDVT